MTSRPEHRGCLGTVLAALTFCGRVLFVVFDFRFHFFLLGRLAGCIGGLRAKYYKSLHSETQIVLGVGACVSPEAIIVATSHTPIQIGVGAYVGRQVQLASGDDRAVRVGDHASVQDYTILLGDVSIGRYCILSSHIFISSGKHHYDVMPPWLIRDQDEWILGHLETRKNHSQPVCIEEDCWIGWGVYIKQGIYVGRGAVLGAYSVVTRDVPPYSVQVGAPNREIRRRLIFSPSNRIDAVNVDHAPYFYAGFLHKQDDVALSRSLGVMFATTTARIMLQAERLPTFEFAVKLAPGVQSIQLLVSCNGVFLDSIGFGESATSRIPLNRLWVQGGVPVVRPSVLNNWLEFEFKVIDSVSRNGSVTLNPWPNEVCFGISWAAVICMDSEDALPPS